MSQANKAVATQFLKTLCVGDVATLKTLMTEDIEAFAMGTSVVSGVRHYQDILAVAAAFPQISKSGLNPEIVSLTAEDDRVSVEWKGQCALINGQQYNNEYHMLFSIRDGKVCRLKEYFCTKLADAVLAPLFA